MERNLSRTKYALRCTVPLFGQTSKYSGTQNNELCRYLSLNGGIGMRVFALEGQMLIVNLINKGP